MAQEEKSDRQSRRSRRLIVAALVALTQEKRYDRITVQEILDRADVGRSTFYAQFRNKDDVLASEFARVLGLLQDRHLASADDPAARLMPSEGLFRHVQEQQPFLSALVRGMAHNSDSQKLHHHHLRDHAARQLALAVGSHPLTVPPEIVADYLASTLLTLIHQWLEHGLPYTPEKMDAIFQQLAMPGIRALLRHEISETRELGVP